jgi:hypothetical protein
MQSILVAPANSIVHTPMGLHGHSICITWITVHFHTCAGEWQPRGHLQILSAVGVQASDSSRLNLNSLQELRALVDGTDEKTLLKVDTDRMLTPRSLKLLSLALILLHRTAWLVQCVIARDVGGTVHDDRRDAQAVHGKL